MGMTSVEIEMFNPNEVQLREFDDFVALYIGKLTYPYAKICIVIDKKDLERFKQKLKEELNL